MRFLFTNKMNVRASKQSQLISIQTIPWNSLYHLLSSTLDI